MSHNLGTACANLAIIKSKIERLKLAWKLAQKNQIENNQYLKFEFDIFFDGVFESINATQEIFNRMEKGLERRKEFLEKYNLENDYQKSKLK